MLKGICKLYFTLHVTHYILQWKDEDVGAQVDNEREAIFVAARKIYSTSNNNLDAIPTENNEKGKY